ncbi:TPA: hypothetical protein DF272_01620 [Candidatus Falkowbacteria bacterium]|nr:hypothetical protein [Candidatus Falkowbacteria bacterium]
MADGGLKLKISPVLPFVWSCESRSEYLDSLGRHVNFNTLGESDITTLLNWLRQVRVYTVNGKVQSEFTENDCRRFRLDLARVLIDTLRRKGDLILENFAYDEACKRDLLL